MLAASSCVLLASAARAEDVERRFRVGLNLAGVKTSSEIRSDSANLLLLVNPDAPTERRAYVDPRDDGAAFGTLTMEPTLRVSVDFQYAFTKLFLLETSIGYQRGSLGEIEVQGQLDNDPFDSFVQPTNFKVFRTPGGDVEQLPIQFTAMWRFRPRSTFNPFLGVGVGYTFVGFDPSDELNTLSANMDAYSAGFAALTQGGSMSAATGPLEALDGATVEADDFIEWHADGGFEWAFKKQWSFVFDLKWTFGSGSLKLRFNGEKQLGVSVPNGEYDYGSVWDPPNTVYGTYRFQPGTGLVDAGCLVPSDVVTQDAFRCVDPSQIATQCTGVGCTLRFPGVNAVIPPPPPGQPEDPEAEPVYLTLEGTDGLPDSGYYYAQGGDIGYGGPSLHLGIRYTF